MHRTKVFAVAALTLFSSACGAFARPTDWDGPHYWQGSREQLRISCAQIGGMLVESTSKTRCYSFHRQALYICKDSGLCQTQVWDGQTGAPGASESLTGGGETDPEGDPAEPDPDDGGIIIIL